MNCANCGKRFDPANRAKPTTQEGSIVQMEYCSEECARKAENKRYYQAHKDEIKKRVTANQRGTRDKTPPRLPDDDLSID